MEWRDLFLAQHANVHSSGLGGDAQFSYQDLVLGGLTEEQMRLRPVDGQNSLAWLVWHMTRCEDVAVNVAIADGEQVLEDGWARKMRIDRTDIGTGMTSSEVAALSERIDIEALYGYRDAVATQTRSVIGAIDDATLARHVEGDRYRKASVLGDHAGWVGDFWTPWRARDFLFLATGHHYHHWGEAITVRSLGGFGVGL